MTPRISVIMPVHNADATLARAIASVLAQTFGDFELIIVDDGSRDGSAGMARLLAIEDRRIRVLRQPPAGAAGALNHGVAAATGEYLAFVGAADSWSPTRLARHLAVMERSPDCGVTLEPEAHDNLFAHRAVFAEAGPLNADLAEGAVGEWLARVRVLTDWRIDQLGSPDVLRGVAASAQRPVVAGAATATATATAPIAARPRRLAYLIAAFLAGQRGRQVHAG